MVASYDILRVTDGTPTAYNLRKIAETDVVSVPGSSVSKPGTSSAAYTVANGDQRYPTTIKVTITDDPNGFGKRGSRSATVSISSYMKYDDGAGNVSYSPVNSFIGFNVALDIPMENADLLDLLEGNLGLIIGAISAGEATSLARVNKLVFGSAAII